MLIFVFKANTPIIMNLKKLLFASTLLFAACGTIRAQEVIAHRGFWKTDGSAQNSLAALVKADSIHCYGSEFDVWLTTDKYITFSKHATREFIRLAPKGTPVYYLEGDLSPQELKEWGCAGPDYHFSVFRKHPEWIKECHDLNMKVNAWTVNETKEMEWLINQGVDFITTNEPVLLKDILKEK